MRSEGDDPHLPGRRGNAMRPGALLLAVLLLLAMAVVAIAVDASHANGEFSWLAAAPRATVVGWIAGVLAATILLGSRRRRPAREVGALDWLAKLGLGLALVFAFGLGSCWLGIGVGIIARK
jgi:hypothetical protein